MTATVDHTKAAAASRMRPVEQTQHVSVAECMEMLRREQWREDVIVILFKDNAPPRVQVGGTMLIVKK